MSKSSIYGWGAVVSYMGTALTATSLIIGGVHDLGSLVATYFAYSFFAVMALHFVAFGVPLWFDLPITKRVPKYLEYGYLVLISISLFEIINFAPRYSLYLQSAIGDEASLERQIAARARSQLQHDCEKGTEHTERSFRVVTVSYFSDEYCHKLAALAIARDRKTAILDAARDKEFMEYVVIRTFTRSNDIVHVAEFKNPIADLIDRAVVLMKFKTYAEKENQSSEAILRWLSLLLLPIGLGMRALKTSLELFADLK